MKWFGYVEIARNDAKIILMQALDTTDDTYMYGLLKTLIASLGLPWSRLFCKCHVSGEAVRELTYKRACSQASLISAHLLIYKQSQKNRLPNNSKSTIHVHIY